MATSLPITTPAPPPKAGPVQTSAAYLLPAMWFTYGSAVTHVLRQPTRTCPPWPPPALSAVKLPSLPRPDYSLLGVRLAVERRVSRLAAGRAVVFIASENHDALRGSQRQSTLIVAGIARCPASSTRPMLVEPAALPPTSTTAPLIHHARIATVAVDTAAQLVRMLKPRQIAGDQVVAHMLQRLPSRSRGVVSNICAGCSIITDSRACLSSA